MPLSDSPPRRWQSSGGIALLVLIAFAGGWFLRDCEPAPPPIEAAPAPECPPLAEPPPCEPHVELAPAVPPSDVDMPRKVRRLPALPPQDEQADRRALLAWARRESSTLRTCNPHSPLRMTVRLAVNEEGEVERAALHPIGAELEPAARACLEQKLRTLRLPAELQSGARELVFAVRL